MPIDPQRLAQDARVHDLKCLPDYFEAVISGAKTHETRKDDRGFKVGDILRLREWSDTRWHRSDGYSGRVEERRVSYIAHPSPHTPIPEGYVVMSLAHLDALAAGEGLDFDITEKRAVIEFMDQNDYDPEKHTPIGIQPVVFAAYDAALDRQHRAIVGALRAKLAELQKELAETESDLDDTIAMRDQFANDLSAAEARVKELEMLLSTETARANEGWRYSDVRRQALNDLICAAHSYKENRENRNGVPLGAYMPGSPTRVLAGALTAARSAVEAP